MERIGNITRRALSRRSSATGRPTAPAAICELWAEMAEIFGLRWTSTQPEQPTIGWIGVLDGLSAADIGVGMMVLRDSGLEWPPSATEFRAMCRKRENAAAYRYDGLRLEHRLSDEARAKGRAMVAAIRRTLV